MANGEFTVKELLTLVVIPKLDKLESELADVRSRALFTDSSTVKELQDLRRIYLTTDKVSLMIGDALRESNARGWTRRERWMGIVLLFTTMGTFTIGIKNAFGI